LATTFKLEQCKAIMRTVLYYGLPKAGLVHTMPHTLVHGPLWYRGFDIPNLYTEQLLSQLKMVVCYGWGEKETISVLIQASMEVMKLEIGLQGTPDADYPDLDNMVMDTTSKR